MCSSASRTSSAPVEAGERASGARISRCARTGAAHGLDVVRRDEVAAVRERTRLGHAQQRDPRARARAEVEARVGARVPEQRDDVAVDGLLDEHPARLGDQREHLLRARNRLERVERRVAVCSVSIRASSGSGG